jgi:uncharacterized membrane protein
VGRGLQGVGFDGVVGKWRYLRISKSVWIKVNKNVVIVLASFIVSLLAAAVASKCTRRSQLITSRHNELFHGPLWGQ